MLVEHQRLGVHGTKLLATFCLDFRDFSFSSWQTSGQIRDKSRHVGSIMWIAHLHLKYSLKMLGRDTNLMIWWSSGSSVRGVAVR